MWFFKKQKSSKNSFETIQTRKNISLPLYKATISIDCFDNRVKQGRISSSIVIGDMGYVACKETAVINSKHKDVAVFINDIDCGFLPTSVGDCISEIYPNENYPCTVSDISLENSPALFVDIMLPYVYGTKGLPLAVTLASESDAMQQNEIKNSKVHDYLSIKYNESTGKFNVYNLSTDTSLGVLSDLAAEKILKKHKNATGFYGIITSITTTYDRITLTPSILLLVKHD